jgi:membrane dipeptidase
MIRGLIERDGVLGISPANFFLRSDWRAAGGRSSVSLEHVFSQIDYVCQMAGDAAHVGLGSDYDGGIGLQSVPAEIDTIADLQKLVSLLLERGYTEEDTAAVMGRNWLSSLERILA